MNISVFNGDVTERQTGALVVNLFEGVTAPGGATGAVDRAMGGLISSLVSDGEIRGKKGELTLIHTPRPVYRDFGPSRVLVAGLGTQSKFDLDAVRSVSAGVARRLEQVGISQAATVVHGAGIGGLDAGACAEAIAEGTLLGTYRFDRYKSSGDETHRRLEHMELVEVDSSKIAEMETGVERGKVMAEAASLARDMVNEPANMFSPTRMAEIASEVAHAAGLDCKVLEREDAEKLGMGAYLGVAAGSDQPPKFIHMTYQGDPANPANDVWLVGKGITFDTGGISLKPAAGMGAMKGDMGGGASVIGAMKAIAALKPVLNVHAVVAATENMPSGRAQRPGDVVRAMNGKYIEVDNTDAEGRLTLADAIGYARSNGASRLVDIATLTGAAVIALGYGNTAVFGNDDVLVDQMIAAGKSRGEPMWRLPLDPVSKDQNESKIADVKNTGGRPAGSITAAHFIAEFVGDTPWVHLDIAATSMTDSTRGWAVPGATGVPARSLVQLVLDLAR
ncbi:MAG: leucyl aminopeptidase [Dehalococcoidia bacterium]